MPTIRIKSILRPDDRALEKAVGSPLEGLVAVIEVEIEGLRSELLIPFAGHPASTWDVWAAALGEASKNMKLLYEESLKWGQEKRHN